MQCDRITTGACDDALNIHNMRLCFLQNLHRKGAVPGNEPTNASWGKDEMGKMIFNFTHPLL